MSSNAMAERAITKQNARQITIIFFIADILLLSTLQLWAADYDGCFLAVAPPATRSLRRATPVTGTPQGSHIPARM
jgi:hypothetical protein